MFKRASVSAGMAEVVRASLRVIIQKILTAEGSESKASLKDVKAALKELRSTLEELKKAMPEKKRELAELEDKINQLESTVDQLEASPMDRVKKVLEDMRAHVQGIQNA